MNIINKDLSLNTRFFEISGYKYEITGTKKGTDDSIFNTIDTIVNRSNGNKQKLRRADLKIMLKKYNAK